MIMSTSESLYIVLMGVFLLVFRMKYKYKHLGSMLNDYYNISTIIVAIILILFGVFLLIKSFV